MIELYDHIWHYAVWKKSQPYMTPACVSQPSDLKSWRQSGIKHGITTNRGDVTCENCLRMMREDL